MPARPIARTSGKTRVCFVTGTRAEFGLMQSTLDAIRRHAALDLQIAMTGMHLDPAHGNPSNIRDACDVVVPWPAGSGNDPATNAINTGEAIGGLAEAFAKVRPDVVLITGDRVEVFAAASAAHLSHIPVAHVHGGDRALGQIDDSLRHAITKLAHVHLPATAGSARRIVRLGEDQWRVHRVGSPGIDGIVAGAASRDQLAEEFPSLATRRYGLLVLHPTDPDEETESRRARMLLETTRRAGYPQVVIVFPNNDPGSRGIMTAWSEAARRGGLFVRRDVPRGIFLGLLRDAAVLAGNSSSGIIEAASFGTPVLDVGPRQTGRERSRNVVHCDWKPAAIARELRRIWNNANPRRYRGTNVYGGEGAGERIAEVLAALPPREKLLRKLIAY